LNIRSLKMKITEKIDKKEVSKRVIRKITESRGSGKMHNIKIDECGFPTKRMDIAEARDDDNERVIPRRPRRIRHI